MPGCQSPGHLVGGKAGAERKVDAPAAKGRSRRSQPRQQPTLITLHTKCSHGEVEEHEAKDLEEDRPRHLGRHPTPQGRNVDRAAHRAAQGPTTAEANKLEPADQSRL